GKFQKGNKLGLGNGGARRMAALRAELCKAFDEGRARQLGDKLFALAMGGNVQAAKLPTGYALGKPREAPDADRLDLDEWRRLRASPSLAQVFHTLDQLADPALAAELFRRHCAESAAALFRQIKRETAASEEAAARFAKNVAAEDE